ncbi:hypothetical protein PIL02S_06094 [Paenibacillus illinoisensis]|uniref:Uncharacterized protein n=1 Tax=Paenibacillus illinoisensis TaxID=59845 RepID=A0A2W0C4B7_9BACL|nr:hypothetical protein PIL02S_06094 [Paenibacillus illinoisensis]
MQTYEIHIQFISKTERVITVFNIHMDGLFSSQLNTGAPSKSLFCT